jgi:hypothetical protein
MTQNLDSIQPGETVSLLYRDDPEPRMLKVRTRSADRIDLENGAHLCRHPQSETPSLREWRVSWPCWYTIA